MTKGNDCLIRAPLSFYTDGILNTYHKIVVCLLTTKYFCFVWYLL
jgi:hypothetical protein